MNVLKCVVLAACVFVCGEGVSVRGQTCGGQWLPGTKVAGLGGNPQASVVWDADGAGPLPAKLVVGGWLQAAGDVRVRNIAVFDPTTQTWSTLGQDGIMSVTALATLPSGQLIAATHASVTPDGRFSEIMRWTGSAWVAHAPGLNSGVNSMIVLSNGDLVVGGNFSSAGSVHVSGLARWDGTAWSAFPSGMERADRLLALPDGGFVASNSTRVARWTGSAWQTLSTGQTAIYGMTLMPNGDLVVGGHFTSINGVPANYIARWNGQTWQPMGAGFDFYVQSVTTTPMGDVLAAGAFAQSGSTVVRGIARWDGSAWQPLGSGLSGVTRAMSFMPDGQLYASGNLTDLDSLASRNIARWNGQAWSAVTAGNTGEIFAMAKFANGDLLAGGWLGELDGVQVRGLTRWNGATWTQFGAPLANAVAKALILNNGDVVVAARDGVSWNSHEILRWNGTAWQRLGERMSGFIWEMGQLPNGDIVIAGGMTTISPTPRSFLLRYDGQTWQNIGGAPIGEVYNLAISPMGEIVVAGAFHSIGGVSANRLARWNGTTWSALADGIGTPIDANWPTNSDAWVESILLREDGSLLTGGSFTRSGNTPLRNLARFDGTAWSPFGGDVQVIRSLEALADGRILANGGFGTDVSHAASTLAIWDGQTWTPFSGGVNASIFDTVELNHGEIAFGGSMTFAGDEASSFFARYTLTGIPTMSTIPVLPQNVQAGQTVTLAATPSNGYRGVSVRWQRDGVPISDGAGGASVGGGVVSGAQGVLASPTRVSTATLVISGAQRSDSGQYTAVFTNSCGSVTSAPASVMVSIAPCTASDVAGANQAVGADGVLTADDIIVFLGWFFASDSRADVAGANQQPTPDGNLTGDDIVVFLGRFFAGCGG